MDVKSVSAMPRTRRGAIADALFSAAPGESLGSRLSARTLVRLLAFLAAAFLFARAHAVWSAYPFALALICASNRFLPLGTLAACLGAASLGIGTPIYVSVYILAFLLRLAFSIPRRRAGILPESPGVFRESPRLRISAAIVSGFAIALYELLAGGLALPSILYGVSMLALTLLFCALFIPFFESGIDPIALLRDGTGSLGESAGSVSPLLAELSALSLIFVGVVSLDGAELFGVSADYTLAATATLVVARRFGSLRGCACGLLCSLGSGLLSIGYTPAFALLGLVSGLLRRGGIWLSAVAGVTVGALLAVYVDGTAGLIALLPELAVSGALALPIMRLSRVAGDATESSETPTERVQSGDGAEVRRLGETFTSLSEVLRGISDTLGRPELSGGARVGDAVWDKHCSTCPRRAECGETARARIGESAERLASLERPSSAALAESLPEDCLRLSEAALTAAESLRDCTDNRRRAQSSSRLAFEYGSVAALLSDSIERGRAESAPDAPLALRLHDALRERGISAESVSVMGARRKRILLRGLGWEGRSCSADELRRCFEEICDCRLSAPGWEMQGERITLEMSSVRRLAAEAVFLSQAKEEPSGDVACSFESRDDRFYALLSDGMGSGADAAYASGLCSVFLEKTLTSGAPSALSLKLLNNLLRHKGSEASSTVDLFELDLLTGRAAFIKSGAVASYVRRGDALFRIRSSTLPMGIMRALDAEQTAFDVRAGDRVILLSDGISQSPEESPWLATLLGGEIPDDPQALARLILDRARESSDCSDDMTVGVVDVRSAATESALGATVHRAAG